MRFQRLLSRSRGADIFGSEPAVFRIAGAAPAPQQAAPQGSNRTITATEDVLYVFSQSDFGFSDSDGHAFAGFYLTTAPNNGVLVVSGFGAIDAGSFVSAATIAAGQLFFEAPLNANGSNLASFTFQVGDSSAALDPSPNTIIVNVLPVNDAPLYRNFNSGSAGSFNEGQAAPLRLDMMGTGLVEDVDSLDFAGGSLRVSIAVGGIPAEDRLGIASGGAVSVSGTGAGSTVLVNGIAIGTIAAGGTGIGEDLVISFDSAAATPTRVQLLVRALTYFNIAENPSSTGRLVRITLNDGDGPQTAPVDLTLGIQTFNDAPVLSAPAASQIVYLPGDPLTPLWAGVTMTDPDNQTSFVGGSLNMSMGGSASRVELMGTRFTVNQIGMLIDTSTGQQVGTLSLFNGSASVTGFSNTVTAEVANALIHAFGFRTEGANPQLGNFTASLTFSDGNSVFGGSLTSNMVQQTVTVGNASPVPYVDLNGVGPGVDAFAFYTEDGAPAPITMGPPVVLDANAGNQLDRMILSLSDPQDTDVLTWGALPAGMTVTVEDVNFRRVITFTGAASPLAYQNLLASVRYATTDDTPLSQRSIEIRVESDGVQSAVARTDISIQATDDLGVARDDLILVAPGGPFVGNVSFNYGFGMDQDPDSFTVSAVNGLAANVNQVLTYASGATLHVQAFGGIHFDPKSAYPAGGVETFTYTLLGGSTAQATLVIGATGGSIVGAATGDVLVGTALGDGLMGLAGSDFLRGGAGGDFLFGGAGADQLEGGEGADRFVFTAGSDSRPIALRSSGAKILPDVIIDFEAGADRIHLSLIDAISGTAANDAFTFIGSGAFTRQAGQLRFETNGARTSVFADMDGDGGADLQIVLLGPVALTAADFFL